jgi:hypothetical protein
MRRCFWYKDTEKFVAMVYQSQRFHGNNRRLPRNFGKNPRKFLAMTVLKMNIDGNLHRVTSLRGTCLLQVDLN